MSKTLDYLKSAKNEGYALGAFNTANIETLKGITQAAHNLGAPIILEASEGEINFIGVRQLAALAKIYSEELNVPIILNLDHAPDFAYCKKAIDAGFDYVHFDGSKLDLTENIKITKQVVEYAHDHGVIVEGEMDHIQGSSADHSKEDPNTIDNSSKYTNPQKAADFIAETGIDVFASFIGNMHGVYASELRLKNEILEELVQMLPSTFFSLHGGSGLNDHDVKKAISTGIVKVNVNTEVRLAYKKTLQKSLNETDEIAVYKIEGAAITAVQQVVETKIKLFGSEGKARVSII